MTVNAAVKHETAPVQSAAGPLVRLIQVTKRFPGAEALQDVTLDLPRGSITGLLGLNSSGKSTLLKLMAGLCRPTSGQVLVEGRAPDRHTKAHTAYLPEVDHLYPWMSVAETLRFIGAFYADWDQERAVRLLDFMALSARQPVGKLSKGMRARLRLVITMARSASLVLLDEPLSGIDLPSRTRIVEAILSEFRSDAQTIILSTHEIQETEMLFDRVVLLHEGRISLDADVEELRAQRGCSIQDLLREVSL